MTILFVGLGTMGEPMARNLARSAEVVVFDLDRETRERVAADLGVEALPDLATVPQGVDTAVMMVPNSRIVESLVLGDSGLIQLLGPGALIVDMSSSEPDSTRRLAAHADAAGVEYVDSPVSGGVTRARSAQLAVMAGATAQAFERARPILEAVGGSIHHVGGPGCGDTAKSLNNLLSATNVAAVAEILATAAEAGIEPAAMLDVINASTGRSQASEVKFPDEVLTGRFSSGFGMDLLLKDLAIAEALDRRAPTPVTDAAHEIARAAHALLGSGRDHTEIARLYENTGGATLRGWTTGLSPKS